MVRQQILRSLAFAVALVVLACSSDAPDPGPVDPDALVLDTLLTSEDFSDGDWQSVDQAFGDIYPIPEPDATPVPVPESLQACESAFAAGAPTPPELLETTHLRAFFQRSPSDLGDATVVVQVEVFATHAAAQAGFEDGGDGPTVSRGVEEFSDECIQALGAMAAGVTDGSALTTYREREPGFDIRGVTVTQGRQTTSSSAGVVSSVRTRASFVRGYVVVTYSATESGDPVVDNEELIRTLVQHAIDAQSGN